MKFITNWELHSGRISGRVYGDNRWDNGTRITTSVVLAIRREDGEWVAYTTNHSRYLLVTA